MTIHLVLVTSLSHDPITEAFSARNSAVARMKRILTDGGWSDIDAARAANAGAPVAIDDRGDDSTVTIRDLQIKS